MSATVTTPPTTMTTPAIPPQSAWTRFVAFARRMGGNPSGKPVASFARSKLSGGSWRTVHGSPVYIKGGKIVAGNAAVVKAAGGVGAVAGGHASAPKVAGRSHTVASYAAHHGVSHEHAAAHLGHLAKSGHAAGHSGDEHFVSHGAAHPEGSKAGKKASTKVADRVAKTVKAAKVEKVAKATPKPAASKPATRKATEKSKPAPVKPATHPATSSTSSPSSHDKPKVTFTRKGSHVDIDQAGVESHVSKLIGKDVKMDDIAAMIGSPHGSKVSVFAKGEHSIQISTEGPGFYSSRIIGKDKDGKAYIKNDFIEVKDTGKGTGQKVFGQQVEHASRLGIDHIETMAARSNSEKNPLVGYKVWPKFGYDAPIHQEIKERLPKAFRKAKNVSDLMATPAGREAWEKHGGGVYMHFDLKAGSKSRKVWADYQAAKAAKG